MFKTLLNAVHLSICSVLIFQLVGCGTIMYPERKGQKAGKIDAGVAVLDGIGLLFFLIPGIIAFAVDFNNGTIYLPGTSRGSLDVDDMKQVKFDPKRTSITGLARVIENETGYKVRLYQDDMQISKLGSVDDMMARFAEVLPGMQYTNVASLNSK